MAAIQVLDSNTINQIAAGEVIERPASVVKELLENAIDSKATAITVEIQGGGLQTIRVTDNGSGIVREEIPLAFKRHATSKIRTASDLFQVASLGFRGEALASIASVAKVELITKTNDSISGSRYRIEGGEELGLEEVGAPEGTTFIARDLFYNTPVRRKFLKTPATEGSHVADLVEKIALSHPEISIRFINNNQSRLHTSGNHNLKDIIYAVFGREITANLIEVDAGADPIRVGGFIGKPLIARGNRTYENYFINGRYIKSSIIGKAIEDAYKPFMMQHKYPFTMLQFTIDPSYIDVNVHPAKTEIKFSDEQAVYRAIYHSIVTALVAQEKPEAIAKTIGTDEKNPSGLRPAPLRRGANVGTESLPCEGEGDRSRWKGSSINARSQECGQATPVGAVPECGPQQAHVGAPTWGARSQESGQAPSVGAVPEGGPQRTAPLSGEPVGTHGLDSDGSSLSGRTPQSAELTAPLRRGANVGAESLPCEGEGDRSRWKGSSLFSQALAQHGQGGPSEATSVVSEASAPKIVFDGDDDVFIPLGEVADCFIIAKKGQDLYIVDQHAAHERIRYDTFCKRVERMPSQQLLTPEFVEVDSEDMTLLLERQDVFNDLGYTYSEAGPTTLRVEEVPCDLQTSDIADSLKDICLLLHDQKEPDKAMVRHRSLAYLSCHGAVKAGDSLNIRQMKQLLDDLFHTEKPYVCPHGRPTIIRFTPKELAHLFKRT